LLVLVSPKQHTLPHNHVILGLHSSYTSRATHMLLRKQDRGTNRSIYLG